MTSYIVWVPQLTKESKTVECAILQEAFKHFGELIINGYDQVTLSQQFADGTYIHHMRYNEKGIEL